MLSSVGSEVECIQTYSHTVIQSYIIGIKLLKLKVALFSFSLSLCSENSCLRQKDSASRIHNLV